MAKAYGVAV